MPFHHSGQKFPGHPWFPSTSFVTSLPFFDAPVGSLALGDGDTALLCCLAETCAAVDGRCSATLRPAPNILLVTAFEHFAHIGAGFTSFFNEISGR